MKKLMSIGLAAALMFAVAAQAQAAVPLETTGELRVRMFYLNDYTGAVSKKGAMNEFWDQRLRLGMNWQVSDSVKLQARADILEGLWGDNGAAATTTTLTTDAAGKTTAATTVAGSGGKAAIDFDWVNMQFKWPGTPLAFTIGRQDASWGLGILGKSDSRDRLKIMAATAAGTFGFVYQKRKEIFAAHDTLGLDDNRQYYLLYLGKGGGWDFGVVGVGTFFDATAGASTSHYIGDVFAKGKAGPADLSFEAFYLTGKTENDATADVDLSAIGAYAGASVPAGPVTIGAEVAYASGNDPSTAENEAAIVHDYHSPFWSIVLFNNMDLNGYAGETNIGNNTGLGNVVAGKLTVTAKPAPGLTIIGAAVYAQRLEDVKNAATGAITKADPLGVELDLVFVYAITPNVSWTIGAGYLIPGDFYGDADNALAAKSQFVLNF